MELSYKLRQIYFQLIDYYKLIFLFMALSKNIPTSYGVDATYWTITRFSIDRVNLSVELQLAWYASEEAEKENKIPLTSRIFNVSFMENPPEEISSLISSIPPQAITEELTNLFQVVSSFAYWLAKKSEDFKDWVDC